MQSGDFRPKAGDRSSQGPSNDGRRMWTLLGWALEAVSCWFAQSVKSICTHAGKQMSAEKSPGDGRCVRRAKTRQYERKMEGRWDAANRFGLVQISLRLTHELPEAVRSRGIV